MPTETPEWKFMRGLPQFSILDDNEIQDLAIRLNKKKYKEGEYIFFQGDQVTSLYFLEMGKVEVYKSDINGKKLTLWFIGEEEILPRQPVCLPSVCQCKGHPGCHGI